MDLIFSTPASTSLPPTSTSGPVSLQVRCLQVVAADLENFPVVSLASLSKRIRVKLLVLLPPADVCKLEKTPVFHDIEEDEVWRTIYYENENGKRHSDSLSAKQLFLSNLLPLIHVSKSTKNRCQNTATIFTLLFQGRGGKVPPRYTHHFQQSTPDKKGEKEVGKKVPSHDTHHAPHEGNGNYSDVHLLGLITDTTRCYPKELYVDCSMFSQLFTPDSYTLLCQYLSHVTHVVLAWNINKVDLLDVPRSVFDLLSPALPLVSLSLSGTVDLLRVYSHSQRDHTSSQGTRWLCSYLISLYQFWLGHSVYSLGMAVTVQRIEVQGIRRRSPTYRICGRHAWLSSFASNCRVVLLCRSYIAWKLPTR